MEKKNIFLALIFVFSAFSCQNKVDGVIVDEELVLYYEIFKEEAEKRGVAFDNSEAKIEGYIQNIVDNGVVGACKRNAETATNPQIIFDKSYWKSATHLEREYVMFHEFGHCYLQLGHDDSKNNKGECISIMASGLGNCRDNYNSMTRDSLLNELFSK